LIPATVDDAPVLDNVLIVFPLILTVADVFEHAIPVTLPPVPVDDKPVIVFDATFSGVAKLTVLPIVIAVIVP